MRLLLDTNIYVFMVSDMDSLTNDVRIILEDPENLKYLSIVSLQELIIAFRTKKLLSNIWETEAEMISFVLNDPSVEIDNTDVNVIRTLAALKINEVQENKDPFDHIIIAQAISHKMTLISTDTKFPFYRRQGLRLIENIK
jgi:PIN domain nuclease of toxin-antitoxin system